MKKFSISHFQFSISHFQFSILFLIIFLGGLFLPLVSLAGTYYTADGRKVEYDGLVPCGKVAKVDGRYLDWQALAPGATIPFGYGLAEILSDGTVTIAKVIPCQFCHFFVMFKGIIDFVLAYIVFPIASLLFIVGGVMFFLYAENPKRIDEAKSLLTSVVIGLVIIFAAWLIINLFFTVIGLSDFALRFTGPGKWFTINCPIKL